MQGRRVYECMGHILQSIASALAKVGINYIYLPIIAIPKQYNSAPAMHSDYS